VKVESNLEQGTSFIVTLDENEIYPDALRGDENASAKLQGNDAASGVLNLEEAVLSVENGKPLLLVVEDNREILDYVAESFIDEFDVLKAGGGREGLALALNKVPDVIISDVMMPNMDGNAMCRALKKDIRTSHIPIILLTAKDSFEAKEKGYDSGVDSDSGSADISAGISETGLHADSITGFSDVGSASLPDNESTGITSLSGSGI
jgi:CheY-like chemotaxis protein